MGSDGRRLWWQLFTDQGNSAESNTRCQEELALVRTFSTFPGINNVNPILLGFNLMNQNEALANKSLVRYHRQANQLKLWGALLLTHYSLTAQLSAALFLLSGGSWRPSSKVGRSFNRLRKAKHRFGHGCWGDGAGVWPFLCVDFRRVCSDDVTQQDSVGMFWRSQLRINPELLNPGKTFAAMATLTDQCLGGSPSLFRFYCPQLSPFIVSPMVSFPDVAGSCFTAGKKMAITPISG